MRNPYGWYPPVVELIRNAVPALNWVGNPQLLLLKGADLTSRLPACVIVPLRTPTEKSTSPKSGIRRQRLKTNVLVQALALDDIHNSAEIVAGTHLMTIAQTLMNAQIPGFLGKIQLTDDDEDPIYTLEGYGQFSFIFEFQFVLQT